MALSVHNGYLMTLYLSYITQPTNQYQSLAISRYYYCNGGIDGSDGNNNDDESDGLQACCDQGMPCVRTWGYGPIVRSLDDGSELMFGLLWQP
jgi:hypothetical protein